MNFPGKVSVPQVLRDAKKRFYFFFYHPDYTVGTGISPVREHALFADFTAGGELHSAPKNIQLHLLYDSFYILSTIFRKQVKKFFLVLVQGRVCKKYVAVNHTKKHTQYALYCVFFCLASFSDTKYGAERGIRTPGSSRFNSFQDYRYRPLSHLCKQNIQF